LTRTGTYEQLIAMKGEIAQLIKTSNNDESGNEETSKDVPESPSTESVVSAADSPESDEEDEADDEVGAIAPIRPNGGRPGRKDSNLTLRRASTASFRGPRGKMTDEEESKSNAKGKQMTKEFSEQGKVKWSVYREYAKASNLVAVGIYLLMLVGAKTAEIG
jgi:hypothetical protein